MSGSARWLARTEDLVSELERIGAGPLALDSEADSFHHYRDKVCLIQLSAAGRNLLIDPLAGIDLSVLGEVLGDADVGKILHGADYDLRILHRDFDITVRGLFDTMIASRLIGERSFGLAALLEKFLDVKLDKRFQRADWSRRPLTEPMKDYAVRDTCYLSSLAEILSERLERMGRSVWAAEEFERLEAIRWNPDRGEEGFLRVKHAKRLDRRQLAVLRELYDLRDRAARRRDVPPFRVLRDEVLVGLARTMPRQAGDLRDVPRIPESWTRGRPADGLLQAVGQALEVPESDLPALPRSRRPRRGDPAREGRLKKLCSERDRIAERLDLEPSLVCPKGVLDQALSRLEQGSDPEGCNEMRRWQLELLRPALEAVAG